MLKYLQVQFYALLVMNMGFYSVSLIGTSTTASPSPVTARFGWTAFQAKRVRSCIHGPEALRFLLAHQVFLP